MNTYDFDKTIYINDSSFDFFFYCLGKHPFAVLRTVPLSGVKGILYALGKIETKELKQQLFSFLKYLHNVDLDVELFWNKKFSGIGKWYLEKRKDDDIIISASPEFLLEPVAKRLGVELMGTVMDKRTGLIQGKNCHDTEKVRRFYERYPDGHSEEFYSDSLSDSPMAEISDKAYMVDHGKLSPWPEN